ncbi:hypothetical protein HL657_00680 [Methanoculleus sp. YWC-01]|uniref:Uncharacterized protein n=1 Tax=Methanoculleus nereidis TaxID=2735141 RepID=A0ABU3YYS0_9EURY|nr:hypothetical protein [Methanoculleus sp. YWC-01]MDV4341712.1 hypothetical protein [Methanoculleus sp. YWC-01]
MVNDSGQLYTMEGVAAGVIMLLTAYIVISTTSIYTPGDTHIPDMQLEQLGSDVLAMMDTPNSKEDGESELEWFIANNKSDDFGTTFLNYCNMMADDTDDLHMSASVTYRNGDSVGEYQFVGHEESWTGRESAVRVTRWVQLEGNPSGVSVMGTSRSRAVLVEVLLWRA